MKLIDELTTVFLGDRSDPFGKLFEGLVVASERGFSLFVVIKGLRGHPSGPDVGHRCLIGHALQSIHVGLERLIGEFAVAAIVHSEVDGHGRGFMEKHISGESRVSTHGSIATDPHISERDLPFGESCHGPHFDVVGIQMLFGDAVADHHHSVTIFEEKIFGINCR